MKYILLFSVLVYTSLAMAASDHQAEVHRGYLTKDDQKILNRGEISDGKYISGGILGSIVGFGSGHAVQRRYLFKGMIFTIGEGAGLLTFLVFGGGQGCAPSGNSNYPNSSSCSEDQVMQIFGLAVIAGFKIWEMIDLWVMPPILNRRYRELSQKLSKSEDFNLHFEPLYVSHDTHSGNSVTHPGLTFALDF
jgi:hypothetical protein